MSTVIANSQEQVATLSAILHRIKVASFKLVTLKQVRLVLYTFLIRNFYTYTPVITASQTQPDGSRPFELLCKPTECTAKALYDICGEPGSEFLYMQNADARLLYDVDVEYLSDMKTVHSFSPPLYNGDGICSLYPFRDVYNGLATTTVDFLVGSTKSYSAPHWVSIGVVCAHCCMGGSVLHFYCPFAFQLCITPIFMPS